MSPPCGWVQESLMPSRIALATETADSAAHPDPVHSRPDRWLGQEAGSLPAVGPTGCMHQEGVADEHVARRAGLKTSPLVDAGSGISDSWPRRHRAGPPHRPVRAALPSPDGSLGTGGTVHRPSPHRRAGRAGQRPLLRSVVHEPAGFARGWKLESMCHPASPGSSWLGNRTTKAPRFGGSARRPG